MWLIIITGLFKWGYLELSLDEMLTLAAWKGKCFKYILS